MRSENASERKLCKFLRYLDLDPVHGIVSLELTGVFEDRTVEAQRLNRDTGPADARRGTRWNALLSSWRIPPRRVT
ncbi:hypothetical protein [Streptomyces sp. NPDC050538]|uniref:hypothetical protein n=1 Tax=Streptomyces sp. NPDC050538 TaxID=3365627 RepID=UPI003787A34C